MSTYFVLPVMEDKEITDVYEFTVMLALADSAGKDTGRCHISLATISKIARCSERQAQTVLRQLAEKGWIAIKPRFIEKEKDDKPIKRQTSNEYELLKYPRTACTPPVHNMHPPGAQPAPEPVSLNLSPEPVKPPLTPPRGRKADREPELSSIPIELNNLRFAIAWENFKKHRKEIRHPLTPMAERLALKHCVQLGASRAIAAIENSIEAGYQKIVEPMSVIHRNGHQKPVTPHVDMNTIKDRR
jgi:hypothetical protein